MCNHSAANDNNITTDQILDTDVPCVHKNTVFFLLEI